MEGVQAPGSTPQFLLGPHTALGELQTQDLLSHTWPRFPELIHFYIMASEPGKSAVGGTPGPEQGALRHRCLTPLPRGSTGSGMSGRDGGHKQEGFRCFMGRHQPILAEDQF